MNLSLRRVSLAKMMLLLFFVLITSVVVVWSFPVLVSAQSTVERYSSFQYHIGPGEGADDAVVLLNPDSSSRSVQISVSDALFDVDTRSFIPVDAIGEDVDETIWNWVRFYPTERPMGSEELEQTLGGGYPARLYPLCKTLQFGELSKHDRDQLAVRSVNRSLEPSEIHWLDELSDWCRGEHSPTLELASGTTTRLPFVIEIPERAKPRYVRAVIVERTNDRRSVASSISIVMPSLGRASIVVSSFTYERQSSGGGYRVKLVVQNNGALPAVVGSKLLVSKSVSGPSYSEQIHSDMWVDGGGSAAFVWEIPRSMMGTYLLRPEVYYFEDGGVEQYRVNNKFEITFVEYPPLSLLILIMCSMLFVGGVIGVRRYWKKRWIREIRASWVLYSPKTSVSVTDLSVMLQVPLKLFLDVNHLRSSDRVQPTDTLLVPPSVIDSQKPTVSKKRSPKARGQKFEV